MQLQGGAIYFLMRLQEEGLRSEAIANSGECICIQENTSQNRFLCFYVARGQ
jgi:hypothetical protein